MTSAVRFTTKTPAGILSDSRALAVGTRGVSRQPVILEHKCFWDYDYHIQFHFSRDFQNDNFAPMTTKHKKSLFKNSYFLGYLTKSPHEHDLEEVKGKEGGRKADEASQAKES